MKLNKKGQAGVLQGVGPAVIILIVIAVILGISSTVLTTIGTTQDDIEATVTNETFTASTNTWVNLNSPAMKAGAVVSNSSGSIFVEGNTLNGYVLDLTDGRINVTNATVNGLPLNITYTSVTVSAAGNATNDGLAGLTTFSGFQPTIAVIVVAVVVIGLLLGGFAISRP